MRKIIYHIATTLDGYIAHADNTTGGFSFDGPHVTAYMQHLQQYDTVIMGKNTYEAGYQFGLKPGEAPYPWMKNFVFSKSADFEILHADKLFVIRDGWREAIEKLRSSEGTDIYLCGGGIFASFLLAVGLIDRLRLKVSPLIFGTGKKLFETASAMSEFKLDNITQYGGDVFLADYSKR